LHKFAENSTQLDIIASNDRHFPIYWFLLKNLGQIFGYDPINASQMQLRVTTKSVTKSYPVEQNG